MICNKNTKIAKPHENYLKHYHGQSYSFWQRNLSWKESCHNGGYLKFWVHYQLLQGTNICCLLIIRFYRRLWLVFFHSHCTIYVQMATYWYIAIYIHTPARVNSPTGHNWVYGRLIYIIQGRNFCSCTRERSGPTVQHNFIANNNLKKNLGCFPL